MNPWLRPLLPLLLLAPLSAWATTAQQCRMQPGDSNFGTHSSLVIAREPLQIQTRGGMACDVRSGAIIGQNWVRLRLENLDGSFLRNAKTGDRIPFDLYADASLKQMLRQGVTYDYANLVGSGHLDLRTFPLHARVRSANVTAGTYVATLQLRWYWRICVTGQALGVCAWPGWDNSPGLSGGCLGPVCLQEPSNWGNGMVTQVRLVLNVRNDCQLSAPALDFGSAPLVSSFLPVQQRIQVRCTKGAHYSVGLSDGSHASNGQRHMASGNARLAYELYKSAGGNERWGAQGAERRPDGSAESNPGQLDGLTAQGFDYRAEILPEQPTPPAGTYTDSVVVDVRF